MNQIIAGIYGTQGQEKIAFVEGRGGKVSTLDDLALIVVMEALGDTSDSEKVASVQQEILGDLVDFDRSGRSMAHYQFSQMEKEASEGNPEALLNFFDVEKTAGFGNTLVERVPFLRNMKSKVVLDSVGRLNLGNNRVKLRLMERAAGNFDRNAGRVAAVAGGSALAGAGAVGLNYATQGQPKIAGAFSEQIGRGTANSFDNIKENRKEAINKATSEALGDAAAKELAGKLRGKRFDRNTGRAALGVGLAGGIFTPFGFIASPIALSVLPSRGREAEKVASRGFKRIPHLPRR